MSSVYTADLSLTLINRTGAYHVARDLVTHLPSCFGERRYWRLSLRREPGGLVRRALGRAMLFELTHARLNRWLPVRGRAGPRGRNPILFLDPLYVLRSDLRRTDVVLCHDVGPLSKPHLFDPGVSALYRDAYCQIAAVRPGMVFVSEASKMDFTTLFGDRFRFLETIPLYVRPASHDGVESRPAGVTGPFILTVGALETRKNYERSIEAFRRSRLAEQGYTYVICGPRGNNAGPIEDLARRTPGVVALGFLPDDEIRWLYRHAEGFLLPSLLEGFGMPALEAAQHGLLSIVSADGALPEAVGEGAILVDPEDPDSIADGMRHLTAMPESERRDRLAQAQSRAADLSLDRFVSRWADLLGRNT